MVAYHSHTQRTVDLVSRRRLLASPAVPTPRRTVTESPQASPKYEPDLGAYGTAHSFSPSSAGSTPSTTLVQIPEIRRVATHVSRSISVVPSKEDRPSTMFQLFKRVETAFRLFSGGQSPGRGNRISGAGASMVTQRTEGSVVVAPYIREHYRVGREKAQKLS